MSPPQPTPVLRALEADDADAYRAIRLEALTAAPEAFGSSFEEEAALPLKSFRARIPRSGPNAIFALVASEGQGLAGMAGVAVSAKIKERHKGTLWGVFVRPAWRGQGWGERLVGQAVAHAAQHVLVLQAKVVTSNQTARRLYQRLGFVAYGIERKALRVGPTFYDEELLALDLGPSSASQAS